MSWGSHSYRWNGTSGKAQDAHLRAFQSLIVRKHLVLFLIKEKKQPFLFNDDINDETENIIMVGKQIFNFKEYSYFV